MRLRGHALLKVRIASRPTFPVRDLPEAPLRCWVNEVLRPIIALVAYRDLILELVRRDFRVRYHGSALGIAWTQLYPLLLLGVYTFVFTVIFPTNQPYFSVYVCFGLTLWRFVAVALQTCSNSIDTQGYLLGRVAFPLEILPIAAVATASVELVASQFVMIPLVVASGITPTAVWLLLPVFLAPLVVICLGAGLLLAVLTPRFRDIRWFVDVGIFMLLHLSPIVWSDRFTSPVGTWLIRINPFGVLLSMYRQALMLDQLPDYRTYVVVALESVIILACGLVSFRRLSRDIVSII